MTGNFWATLAIDIVIAAVATTVIVLIGVGVYYAGAYLWALTPKHLPGRHVPAAAAPVPDTQPPADATPVDPARIDISEIVRARREEAIAAAALMLQAERAYRGELNRHNDDRTPAQVPQPQDDRWMRAAEAASAVGRASVCNSWPAGYDSRRAGGRHIRRVWSIDDAPTGVSQLQQQGQPDGDADE